MTTATASSTLWHEFALPLQTEHELAQLVLRAFGARIPDTRICEHHSTPWAAFCAAYFSKSPVAVWKASRGLGGKSYLLALLGLVEALTFKADVNILGGSGKQSQNVLEHMRDFWQYPSAPRDRLASELLKMETLLTNGAKIEALLASQTSARGPHVQRLRLDEIDEMDLKILDAALGQTMKKNGVPAQTVLSSTHQNSNGTMTAILKRAADKGWPVFEWCYRETLQPHGWLEPEEVTRKQTELTAAMFANEIELQEPSPETRAIQPDAVARMFKRELGEFAGRPREYIEVEEPQPGARYATGADWARKRDWTVIVTIRTDSRPRKLVAFERLGREGWPGMIGRFNARLQRYPGVAAHDGTGLGDVVSAYIDHAAQGVLMVGRDRADMLTEYISAIERGEIAAPLIRYMESEHRLASVEDVYGSGESHHLPDSMSAGALAWHVARRPSGADLIGWVTLEPEEQRARAFARRASLFRDDDDAPEAEPPPLEHGFLSDQELESRLRGV